MFPFGRTLVLVVAPADGARVTQWVAQPGSGQAQPGQRRMRRAAVDVGHDAQFEDGGAGEVDVEAGEEFHYSDSGAHLLSAILARVTGRSVLAYAREKLFDPLGIAISPFDQVEAWQPIGSIDWTASRGAVDLPGINTGSSELRLTGQDMAKLGLLMLQGGCWERRQVVPALWVRQATTTQADSAAFQVGYGYQWWTGRTSDGETTFSALGAGHQTILVVPDQQTVVTYQIWRPESGDAPAGALVRELVATTVLPALAP